MPTPFYSPIYREFGPEHPSRLRDVAAQVNKYRYGTASDVVDIFLGFLQEYFAGATDVPGIENYRLVLDLDGGIDMKNSKIVIVDSENLDPEVAAGRPIIETSLGAFGFMNLGMGQLEYTNLVDPTEKKIYRDLMRGSINLNVYASDKQEAINLASLVQAAVVAHSGTLEKMGMHQVDRTVQVGTTQPGGLVAANDTELVMAPVIVGWYKAYRWSREYTAPTPEVNNIDVQVVTEDVPPGEDPQSAAPVFERSEGAGVVVTGFKFNFNIKGPT